MAPRKPRTIEQQPDDVFSAPADQIPGNLPALYGNSEDFDDVTDLNRVLNELGASSTTGNFVTVFRETASTGGRKEDEFLERFDNVNDFSLQDIKNRYGGGRYKINVYRPGALVTRKVITIAGEKSVPASAQSTDLSAILQTMQSGFDKMFQALATRPELAPVASRMDMLNEMMIMREMFSAPTASAQPAPPAQSPIELMKAMIELNTLMAGGEGNNMAWIATMMEKYGEPLIGLATQAVAGRRPVIRSPGKLPGVIAAKVAPNNPTPTDEGVEPVNMMVMQYLRMLATAAEKNEDVSEYADSILNMLPAPQLPELDKLIRPDNWREAVRMRAPVIDKYPEWFTALRDTLIAYIDEDKQNPNELTSDESGDTFAAHESYKPGNSAPD